MKSVISQIYANPELQIQSMQQSKEPYDAKIIFQTSDWTKIQTFDIDIKKESLVWMAENSTKIYLSNVSKLKVLKKNLLIICLIFFLTISSKQTQIIVFWLKFDHFLF